MFPVSSITHSLNSSLLSVITSLRGWHSVPDAVLACLPQLNETMLLSFGMESCKRKVIQEVVWLGRLYLLIFWGMTWNYSVFLNLPCNVDHPCTSAQGCPSHLRQGLSECEHGGSPHDLWRGWGRQDTPWVMAMSPRCHRCCWVPFWNSAFSSPILPLTNWCEGWCH